MRTTVCSPCLLSLCTLVHLCKYTSRHFSCRCNQLEWLMVDISASLLLPLFFQALQLPLQYLVSYCLSSWESTLYVHRGAQTQPLQSTKEALSCRKGRWGDSLQVLTHQICIFVAYTEKKCFVFKACSCRTTMGGGLYGSHRSHFLRCVFLVSRKVSPDKSFHRLHESQHCCTFYQLSCNSQNCAAGY